MALAAGLIPCSTFALPATRTDDTVTITGKGTCAKCDLKEADKCQSVRITKDGKTVTLLPRP